MALANGDGQQETESSSNGGLLAASASSIGNESKSIGLTRSANQKGKTTTCRVVTLRGSTCDVEISKAAVGQELFDAVVNDHVPMQESAFFSLSYEKFPGIKFWLNMTKKIEKQLDKCPWVFFMEVKFYPPEPNVLSLDETRYQLTLQVRNDIMSGRLPCSFHTYVVLGSYTVQSELGDFDPPEHGKGIDYLRSLPLAPGQSDELLERIAELHQQHKGLKPAEAELLFLDVAKKLALYGVSLYRVREQSRPGGDKELLVGVSSAGLYVYDDNIRINVYKWPRIHKMSYKHNVFQLKTVSQDMYEKKEEQRNFKCISPKLAKRLWLICVETHQFFRLKQSELTDSSPLIFSTRRNIGMSTTLYQLKQQQQDTTYKASRLTVNSSNGSTGDTHANGSLNTADYLVAGKDNPSADTSNIEDSFATATVRSERERNLPLHSSTPEKECPIEIRVDNLIPAVEGTAEATDMLETVEITVPALAATNEKNSTMVHGEVDKDALENSMLAVEGADAQTELEEQLLQRSEAAVAGAAAAAAAGELQSSESDSSTDDRSSLSLPLPGFSLESFGVGLDGQLADGDDCILTERHEKFSAESSCSAADPSRRVITISDEKDKALTGDADDAALLDAIRSVIDLDLNFVVDRIELQDEQGCKDV